MDSMAQLRRENMEQRRLLKGEVRRDFSEGRSAVFLSISTRTVIVEGQHTVVELGLASWEAGSGPTVECFRVGQIGSHEHSPFLYGQWKSLGGVIQVKSLLEERLKQASQKNQRVWLVGFYTSKSTLENLTGWLPESVEMIDTWKVWRAAQREAVGLPALHEVLNSSGLWQMAVGLDNPGNRGVCYFETGR